MPWLADGRWVDSYEEAKAIIHGRTSRKYIPFYGYEPSRVPPPAMIKESMPAKKSVKRRKSKSPPGYRRKKLWTGGF
jgi:hypothetical protein